MATHHFLPSHRFSSALSPLLNCFQQTITIRKVSSFLKNITKPNIEIRKKKKTKYLNQSKSKKTHQQKNAYKVSDFKLGFLKLEVKTAGAQSTRDLIDLRNPSQFAILVIFFFTKQNPDSSDLTLNLTRDPDYYETDEETSHVLFNICIKNTKIQP